MTDSKLKFTITVTLDDQGTYNLVARGENGYVVKHNELRNALQWALNNANDNLLAAMVHNIFQQYAVLQDAPK